MELRDRLYPYPILASFKDDYYDSEFNVYVTPTISAKNIVFEFQYNLINEGIWDLLATGKAKVVAHIECPSTSFRTSIDVMDVGSKIEIPSGQVNNLIQICSFIVANEDINGYKNDDFNEVYEGLEFQIDKYNFLALGSQINIPIEKDYDEIKNITSIFSVIRSLDPNLEFVERDFYQDKIYIKIPAKQFDMYKISIQDPTNHSYMHSMILVPVLIEIFESLKRDEWEELEDKRWFKSLLTSLKKMDIYLTEETAKFVNVFPFVQKITESPILSSLENLFVKSILNLGEDDEY